MKCRPVGLTGSVLFVEQMHMDWWPAPAGAGSVVLCVVCSVSKDGECVLHAGMGQWLLQHQDAGLPSAS